MTYTSYLHKLVKIAEVACDMYMWTTGTAHEYVPHGCLAEETALSLLQWLQMKHLDTKNF